jgi:hypothetical protein
LIDARAVTERVGPQGQTQLASVVLPAVLLAGELWALVHPASPIAAAETWGGGISGWILALLTLVSLAALYVTGVFLRTAAWFLFRLERRHPDSLAARAIRWLRRLPWGLSVKTRDEFFEGSADGLVEEMRLKHGRPLDDILEWHPALRTTLAASALEKPDAVLAYCSSWLRRFAPELIAKIYEIEINFHVAMIWPLALAPFVVARRLDWLHATGWWWVLVVVAAAVAIAATRLSFRRAHTRQRYELADLFEEFCLAQWFARL